GHFVALGVDLLTYVPWTAIGTTGRVNYRIPYIISAAALDLAVGGEEHNFLFAHLGYERLGVGAFIVDAFTEQLRGAPATFRKVGNIDLTDHLLGILLYAACEIEAVAAGAVGTVTGMRARIVEIPVLESEGPLEGVDILH